VEIISYCCLHCLFLGMEYDKVKKISVDVDLEGDDFIQEKLTLRVIKFFDNDLINGKYYKFKPKDGILCQIQIKVRIYHALNH